MSRWRIAALALAAAWWLIDLGVLGAGVPAPLDDTWEYGVVARHLLAGDGLRTGVIHPPLWGLHDGALTVPMLVHGPLLPLLLAPLIAGFGPGAVDAMAWLAAVFAFATAVLLDRVVARRGGDLAAATCVMLFTLSPLTLAAVHHDASMVIGAFFLLASIAALEASRPRAIVAGLMVSIGTLVRPELTLAGIVLGVFAPRGTLWWFLAALVAPRLAWIAYRGTTTGLPLFDLSSYLLLADTSRYPELSALRRFDLSPDRVFAALVQALPTLGAKWAYAAPRAMKHALTAPSVLTGWLAALDMVVASWRVVAGGHATAATVVARANATSRAALPALEPDASASRTARDLLLMSIPVALLIATERRPTLIVPFLPLWAWAAWRGLLLLWRRGTIPTFAAGVLALLALSSGVLALRDATVEAVPARAWLARERAALATATTTWDAGGPAAGVRRPESVTAGRMSGTRTIVVLSDAPDFVTWTTRRPSVWITRDELARLQASPASWPDGLPRVGAGAATWFHEDPRRDR